MEKAAEFINKISIRIVTLIFGVILLYLTVLSLLSTSVRGVQFHIDDAGKEVGTSTVFFIADYPWKHLLFGTVIMALFLLLQFWIKRMKHQGAIKKIVQPAVLCGLLFVFSVIYILSAKHYPGSDPAKLMKAAAELLAGDFHQFETGEYMHRYPFQSGFVLYICLFLKAFGEQSYLFIQIINAAALAAAYYYISKIICIIWEEDGKRYAAVNTVFMILFIPMFFYITFVYGNLLGFMLAMLAIYHELLFFRDQKYYRILLASLFIALAIIFKNNYLVVMVAMLLLLAVKFFKEKKKLVLICFAASILGCYLISGQLLALTMKSILGFELPAGLPKSTWVVMGLSEGGVAPGHFNGRSVSLYKENNYDYQATNQAAIEKVVSRLNGYWEDKKKGLDFFGRKQASQWSEPTFQCFSTLSAPTGEGILVNWSENLRAGRGSLIVVKLLNIYQTFLFVGALLYLFLYQGKRKAEELIFAIIFIGGFLFHFFWEAKSQYVLFYFVLLIPYATYGYMKLARSITKFTDRWKNRDFHFEREKLHKKTLLTCGIVLILILAMGFFSRTSVFQYILTPRSDAEAMESYQRNVNNKLGKES